MSRGGQAWATFFGSALGLGVGLAGTRAATMNMEDQELRANLVLIGSVLGAATVGAVTAYATAPKQLSA